MLAALFDGRSGMVGALPVRWEAGKVGWMLRGQKRWCVARVQTYCQRQITDSQHVFFEGDMEGQFQT